MSTPTFAYTTYIRTTPQKLWQALTEPAFTRRYWATEFTTDWSVGSPMTWDNHGVVISDPEQVVLERVVALNGGDVDAFLDQFSPSPG